MGRSFHTESAAVVLSFVEGRMWDALEAGKSAEEAAKATRNRAEQLRHLADKDRNVGALRALAEVRAYIVTGPSMLEDDASAWLASQEQT